MSTRGWSGLAYDNGRVFALNYDGDLRAFAAASGALLWQTQLTLGPNQVWAFTSAPTALNGLVYTGASRNGGTLFAVSAQDGSIRWTASNPFNADFSSPAVSPDGVYVNFSCVQAYDYAPATGDLIWHHASPCFGGGGTTTVLYGNRLYAREHSGSFMSSPCSMHYRRRDEQFRRGSATGVQRFHRILLPNVSTYSRDVATSFLKCSSRGRHPHPAPIVVNGYVYIGSNSGQLFSRWKYGANVWPQPRVGIRYTMTLTPASRPRLSAGAGS